MNIKTAINRFRLWHLHRYADDLRKEAIYHGDQAVNHRNSASLFWNKLTEVRRLIRRVEGARSV